MRAPVLLVLVLLLLPGVARADTDGGSYPDAGSAWAACFADKAEFANDSHGDSKHRCHLKTEGNVSFDYQYLSQWKSHADYYYPAGVMCADTSKVWVEETKTCETPFDSEACLARNSEPGFANVGVVSKPFYERCVGGCQYKAQPGYSVVHVDGAPYDLVTGEFMFTGQPCAPEVPTEDPSNIQNPKPQECVTVPGGGDFPMCVKNNGEHCLTAPSTGRQFCWRPGEVGEKTGGPALQKREAGTVSTPPTSPPPANSSFVPDGGTVTTQTTVNSNVIVTTFTSYYTDSGVDAGPTDSSEPADGTGGGSSSGDDDPGNVSGGVDCDNPPVVQGGDPLLANVILQTWGTRCAVESANAVTSSGDIGNCKSVWTIDGPPGDANVEKLKAARAAICGPDSDGDGISDDYEGEETPPTRDEGIASGDTNEDGTGGEVTADQVFGEGVSADTGDLDWSGWGLTRTCPTIPPITLLSGQVVLYDTAPLCSIMQTLGHILLLLSSLVALRIMGGGIP